MFDYTVINYKSLKLNAFEVNMNNTVQDYFTQFDPGDDYSIGFNAKEIIRELLVESGVFYKTINYLNEKKNNKPHINTYRKRIELLIKNKSFDYREDYQRVTNLFFADLPVSFKGPNFVRPEQIRTKQETYVKLVKYLHGGNDTSISHTRGEIADRFGFDEVSLSHYITELSIGVDIFGTKIKLDNGSRVRRGNNTIEDTIHPVFLGLNISQIIFLTITIQEQAKDLNMSQQKRDEINELANLFYSQLSEYGRSYIDGIKPSDITLSYIKDRIYKYDEGTAFYDDKMRYRDNPYKY